MVFDGFRQSFDELLQRATRPEERRAVASRMKDTLVQARVGLGELRDALEKARQRLAAEQGELDTVRRRKQLAEGINDRETVGIATKYEEMHQQRVDVLRQKVSIQESELSLAERDVESMSAELKAVMSGAGPAAAQPIIDTGETAAPGPNAELDDELDSLRRARASTEREADAARRLDELKRRMGK